MTWLWIVLALLTILSSITWILPSAPERRQGEKRMKAIRLGMKVRILSLDGWVKERLGVDQLSQYIVWSDKKLWPVKLWRIPGLDECWTTPPEADSRDLVSSEFSNLLLTIPADIMGLACENGCVWVAIDDRKDGIEPDAIRMLLDQILTTLVRDLEGPL